MTEILDPYAILGVTRAATRTQIRAAYVARARAAHPDLVGVSRLQTMQAINEAWAMLKDPGRRSDYDAAAFAADASAAEGGGMRGSLDPNKPFWTGAMGSPPGRPSGPVLADGIFAGWSIGEIARRDRGYLHWLRDRPEAKPIRAEIEQLLDPTAEDEPQARVRRR